MQLLLVQLVVWGNGIDMSDNEAKSILLKMLDDADKVLTSLGIEYWLDCGTLLGAIRDNQLISWDKDIDLGCWKSANDYEIKQKLKKKYEELGYEVFITDHYLNIHFEDNPELNLDLNFYIVENEYAITPSSSLYPYLNNGLSKLTNHMIKSVYNKKYYLKRYSAATKILFKIFLNFHNAVFALFPLELKSRYLGWLVATRKKASGHKAEVVPKVFFEEIFSTDVLGGKYPTPKRAESYLQYRYGDNWRSPVKDWDTLTQDGTVK